jgi:hypothetical protein
VVFINTWMKATVLEDASLEVLQKQRVAGMVV